MGCSKASDPLETQLDAITLSVTGSFAGQAPNALADDGAMQDIFHKFAPIEAPQFGERVLYYQISNDGADGEALQAKIFVLESNRQQNINTMNAYVLAPGQAPNNLEQHPDAWALLDPEDLMSFPEECGFTWLEVDDGFIAQGSEDCTYPSKAFKQQIKPEMSYRVYTDRLEWEEALYGEDGEAIVTTNGFLTAYRQ